MLIISKAFTFMRKRVFTASGILLLAILVALSSGKVRLISAISGRRTPNKPSLCGLFRR